MTFSQGSNGFAQILGRIKSLDKRIDAITGTQTEPTEAEASVSGKIDESAFGSFADVLSGMQRNLPPRANRWVVEDALQKASEATGVDLDLLKAVMQQESGGNSNAISSAGAKGLMQMIDSTAASMGVKDPFDPHQNALGGAKYLKQQLERFGGNIALALAAYNAGPEAVSKYAGIPPYTETQNYVRSIAAIYDGMKRRKASTSG